MKGLQIIDCRHKRTKVTDSRQFFDEDEGAYMIRRRRLCQDCSVRFTTIEILVEKTGDRFSHKTLEKLRAQMGRKYFNERLTEMINLIGEFWIDEDQTKNGVANE